MGSYESPARRNVLPRDVPDFVGREAELAALLAAARQSTVAAVDGMAGVGKTTLAVHAAHQLAARYPDGQLYLDLHAHSADFPPVTPGTALDTLLRLLGVTGTLPDELAERTALWRTTVAGKRVLILLDNAADVAQVDPLLPHVPGCLVLITSRRRLADLPGVRTISLDVMRPEDAAALFARSVGDERPGVDPEAAAETVNLCGNLPVAIRIAGARLRHRPTWTVGHLVRRLRHEHHRLAELQVEDRSVSAAFALSYRQLRPEQQRLYRLLGTVPGPDVDVDAVAALAGLAPLHTAHLLDGLLDRHLLVQHLPARYTFHDLMRQHAREAALAEEPEQSRQEALTRLLDHYRDAAGDAAELVAPTGQRPGETGLAQVRRSPANQDAALDWLESERETLLAAVRHAAKAGWAGHAWRIAVCLAHMYYVRGHAEEWVPCLEIALAAAQRSGETRGEAEVLIALGMAYENTGHSDRALDCQRRAVLLYQELGDRAGEATAIKRLGNAHLQLGHIGEALGLYQRAHAFFRAVGDPLGVASSLNNIGVAHHVFGRLSEALEHYQGALVIYQQHDDLHAQGLLMVNIGIIQSSIGRYEEGLTSLNEALAAARRLGDRWREGSALTWIGNAYRDMGRHDEAIECQQQALDLLREAAHPGARSSVANDLAETFRAAGRYAMSFHYHGEALTLARQGSERRQEARALDGLAQVYATSAEPGAAAEHWRQALAIYADLGLPEADQVRTRLGTAARTDSPRPAPQSAPQSLVEGT